MSTASGMSRANPFGLRLVRWRTQLVALLAIVACDAVPPGVVLTGTIGPAGGTVSLAGGVVTVVVPANAVSSNVTLTAQASTTTPTNARYVAGSAYDIGPDGQTFAQPVTVTVNFSALTLPTGIRAPEVRINKVVSGAWAPVAGGTNDSTARTATGSTTSLSTYGLVGVPVASVSVTPTSVAGSGGATAQLTATPRDAANAALSARPVTWTTSNAAAATVSATGLVTFQATGSATITATSETVPGTATATTTGSGVVGPAGGTVVLAGGAVTVVVPAGALSGNVTLTAQASASPPANARYVAGSAYDLGPDGQAFSQPVTITVNFSALTLPAGIRNPEVRLNKVISGAWSQIAAGTNDSVARTATATTSSLSTYGVVGVPVASVAVTPASVSGLASGTAQLTATPRDAASLALPNRTVAWTTSNAAAATVSGTGLVTFQAAGSATITATSETIPGTATATTTVLNPNEPIYSASNSDHKLHVEETWANLPAIANLFTSARSDGGPAWKRHSGAVADPAIYITLVSQSDGFGSAKHLHFDFDKDPPRAPHGTGLHAAGFHWFLSAGEPAPLNDQNVVAEISNNVTSTSSNTITDNTKNWPVNYWVGHVADVYAADGLAGGRLGILPIISNTATTLTVNATWSIGAASSYVIGADGTTRSWVRGIDVANPWSNKPSRDAIIYEFALRYTGSNYYEGKTVDIGPGTAGGTGRWLFDHFADPFGIGGSGTCADVLCQGYYTNNGNTPKFAGLPDNSRRNAPAVHQSSSSLTALNGTSFVVWKQNAFWGPGAGQFQWGEKFNAAPKNADFTGTNKAITEAGWMYYKLRITREDPANFVYGRGRLEMWMGPTPGSLFKVMDFLGDLASHPAFGKVGVDPTGTVVMPSSLETVYLFAPTANTYQGGGFIDLGTFRIWSQSR